MERSPDDMPPAAEPAADRDATATGDGDSLDIAADVRAAAQNRYIRAPDRPVEPPPAFTAAEEAEFRGAQAMLINPPPSRQKTQILVLSLLAFIGSAAVLGHGAASFVDLGLLVGVILFHELGHMAGMVLFGYRDVRIFFIPFLGGAASGRKRGVERWKEAVVLLLGPLPGIIAGCVIARSGAATGWVHTLAMQLVVVNALNLLPIAPLDGGQLFSVLLFSRNRHLEVVFTAVTGVLIGVAGVLGGVWVIAIVSYLVLVSLPYKKRVLELAHHLRDTGLPADPGTMTEAQQRRVWRAMWNGMPEGWRTRWRGRPQLQARAMEEIVDRATLEPPGIEMTLGILGVWFVGLVIAGVGAVPHHDAARWQTYRNASPHFTVEFPGAPKHETQIETTILSTSCCRLAYRAVPDSTGWLDKVAPATTKPLFETSHERRVRGSGDTYTRAVINNGVGFVLVGKGDDAKYFIESFHLLE